MKKINFANLKRNFMIAGLKLKKHAPEIMIVGGCGATIVGTVLACKETLKLEETLDEVNNDIQAVKNNDEADKKELAVVYAKGAGKVAKLYAPAVITTGAGIGLILGGNKGWKKQNAAAIAAYAAVDSMYKKYRQNVIEKYGEQEDFNMRFGAKEEVIEEVVTDAKGKSKVVKKKETVVNDYDDYSEYARWFDESNPNWDKDPEYNLCFLNGVQNMCNNRLYANGYLFLNDVYDALGMERSLAGQFVGWVYDEKDPMGDNRIKFGIYNDIERNRAFVNGFERNVLLDFNVDGDICNSPKLKMYLEDFGSR